MPESNVVPLPTPSLPAFRQTLQAAVQEAVNVNQAIRIIDEADRLAKMAELMEARDEQNALHEVMMDMERKLVLEIVPAPKKGRPAPAEKSRPSMAELDRPGYSERHLRRKRQIHQALTDDEYQAAKTEQHQKGGLITQAALRRAAAAKKPKPAVKAQVTDEQTGKTSEAEVELRPVKANSKAAQGIIDSQNREIGQLRLRIAELEGENNQMRDMLDAMIDESGDGGDALKRALVQVHDAQQTAREWQENAARLQRELNACRRERQRLGK